MKKGGRIAGTPNRLTSEVREQLKTVLSGELGNLQERLEKLKDKDRLEIIVKLLPFIVPKMSEVDLKQDKEQSFNPIEVIIHSPKNEKED